MPNLSSNTAQLLDVKIEGGLARFVDFRRELGVSWRRIAQQLKAETGVSVNHETLRAWWAEDVAAGSPDTAAARG